MTLQNNTLLQGGKYKIVRFIARGGFGCTYEAEHVMLGKRVAIKEFFVKDFCNRDDVTAHVSVGTQSKKPLVEKLKKKFIEEARAISGLSHHGIVTVTDVFEENGTAYFVMGYIDGTSVAEILKSKDPRTNRPIPIPEAKAVKYIRQVCGALAYVHEHNRLHLDIKPGNIMIDSNDNAILIDFGTSKQYDEESGENTSTLSAKTPGYAPLEQMSNKVSRFSAATDIYALGATMYKMLTGETPPEATDLASGEELLPPLPDTLSPNVKEAVSAAMQLQKDKRPQSISKFLELLDKKDDNDEENESTLIEIDSPIRPQSPPSTPEQPKTPSTPKPKRKRKYKFKIEKVILGFGILAIIAVIGIALYSANNTAQGPSEETQQIVVEKKYVIAKEFTNSNGKTFKFTGDVVGDSLPTGHGIGQYDQGTYTGDYVNGVRQGEGEFKTIKTEDGQNIFKGTFENDHYSKGTLKFNESKYFVGTFKNDEPYNGDYYENNKKVGKYTNGNFDWL